VILLDQPSSEMMSHAEEAGLNLYQFHKLLKEGLKLKDIEHHEKPSLDSIAITCFTSGSTG